jgi:hypothetical protein
MTQPITVNSRWRGKHTPIEVTVTRVTTRNVSYIALHASIAGTLPQWQFLQDFQPLPDTKQKLPKPANKD